MSHTMAFHQGLHCLLDGNSLKGLGASCCRNLTSSPLRWKIDYSVLVLVCIGPSIKNERVSTRIAQGSCMIH